MIAVINDISYGWPLKQLDEVVSANELYSHPEEVKLVMFTGGEDVHPSLYGGIDLYDLCMTNIYRDDREKAIFGFCMKHGIKVTGICRGIQFINVMAGGFMYQHINGHCNGMHDAYFPYDGITRKVTSTHHQLVGLPDTAIPIAWSSPSKSDIYIGPHGDKEAVPEHEIESAIFPNINAMGVQYHPEMLEKDDPCVIHYVSMVSDFIKMDLKEFINKYGRRAIHGRNRKAGQSGR